ncbi:MAG: site-specific integrase [bacterium]
MTTDYSAFLQDEKGMALSSRRSYLRAVTNFLKIAHGQPERLFLPPDWAYAAKPGQALRRLDKRAVEGYLNHLRIDRGWSPASLALQASALRSFFAFLQSRGHVERNPARSLKPRVPQREEIRPEGDEDAVLRLFQLDGSTLGGARILLLMELMYGGALQSSRVYDIRSLKVARKEGKVKIETPAHSLEVALGAGGLERARRYLEHRKSVVGRKKKAAFWVGENGAGLSAAYLAREIKREMERAELEPRPSLLRQLAARHFAERGGDIRSLRELLHAKRLGSLDRYAPTSHRDVFRQFREAHPREGGGE